MDHVGETFVTPVFNGSASLRSAAGQMIENVTKSVRRNEKIDDAYYDKLYNDITSLYRLDSVGGDLLGKKDLGELPLTAKLLLGSLCAAWAVIALCFAAESIKKRKVLK